MSNNIELENNQFLTDLFEKNRKLCFDSEVESIIKENIMSSINLLKLNTQIDQLRKQQTKYDETIESWKKKQEFLENELNEILKIHKSEMIKMEKEISILKDEVDTLEQKNDKLNDKIKNRDDTIKRISKNKRA